MEHFCQLVDCSSNLLFLSFLLISWWLANLFAYFPWFFALSKPLSRAWSISTRPCVWRWFFVRATLYNIGSYWSLGILDLLRRPWHWLLSKFSWFNNTGRSMRQIKAWVSWECRCLWSLRLEVDSWRSQFLLLLFTDSIIVHDISQNGIRMHFSSVDWNIIFLIRTLLW